MATADFFYAERPLSAQYLAYYDCNTFMERQEQALIKSAREILMKRQIVIVLILMLFAALLIPQAAMALDGPANGTEGDDAYDVTFYAHVDPKIETFTNYVHVEVQNLDNYSLCYEYKLYQTNNYLLRVQLPAGRYKIVSGGIRNDWKDEYPIEYKEFTVGEGANTFVEFNIGKPENIPSATDRPQVGVGDDTPEPGTTQGGSEQDPQMGEQLPEASKHTDNFGEKDTNQPAPEGMSLWTIILIIVVATIALGVIAVGVWAFIKSKNNK